MTTITQQCLDSDLRNIKLANPGASADELWVIFLSHVEAGVITSATEIEFVNSLTRLAALPQGMKR